MWCAKASLEFLKDVILIHTKVERWDKTTSSKTLDKNVRIEIGLKLLRTVGSTLSFLKEA